VNYQFQNLSWEREARFELLKADFIENKSAVNDITALIARRLFLAEQFVEAVKSKNTVQVTEAWNRYMDSVEDWNKNLGPIRVHLDSFAKAESSELVTDYDDLNNLIPASLHYKFYRLHEYLLELRKCAIQNCVTQDRLYKIGTLVSQIGEQRDSYILKISSDLYQKNLSFERDPGKYVTAK
jgi:hypothetical protein